MSYGLKGVDGRYSEQVVKEVLAQVEWDKAREALRLISPQEHVTTYMRKIVGDPNLRSTAVDASAYSPEVGVPDYVFEHYHSRHTGPMIEWMRIYQDPTFKWLKPVSQYSDSRVEGGVRLTLNVPNVGTVVVEVLDVSDGHMSNW